MSAATLRVLILGASGMLGHTALRFFYESPGIEAWGTVRSRAAGSRLPAALQERLIPGVDVENPDSLAQAFAVARPDVVINCVGLVKQLAEVNDPLVTLPLNAMLPHRLARLCGVAGARLIHVSTDCVFSGERGGYVEADVPDARDLYGLSKYLGEVDQPNAVTLRTSIIGPELGSANGLVEWFLAQEGQVRGFTKAVFSGLSTLELSRVIRDRVLPRPELRGLYHVSVEPIAKHDLLRLVADIWSKDIEIVPDDRLRIDRSLDSSRFRAATGYTPPSWPEMVAAMKAFG